MSDPRGGACAEGSPPPAWMDRVLDRLDDTGSPYFTRHAVGQRTGRASAVLMLFGPTADGAGDVVLTLRTAHLRSHAGQVAFPGGRIDPEDSGPVAAALREAREEIGLDPEGVRVLGVLPEVFLRPAGTGSGSTITPVLAWWERPGPIFVNSPVEVDRVARVPLATLLDPANRFTAVHPRGVRTAGFAADGLFVWGFTAALLTAVLDLGGIDPGGWDARMTRPVPGLPPVVDPVPDGSDGA